MIAELILTRADLPMHAPSQDSMPPRYLEIRAALKSKLWLVDEREPRRAYNLLLEALAESEYLAALSR